MFVIIRYNDDSKEFLMNSNTQTAKFFNDLKSADTLVQQLNENTMSSKRWKVSSKPGYR